MHVLKIADPLGQKRCASQACLRPPAHTRSAATRAELRRPSVEPWSSARQRAHPAPATKSAAPHEPIGLPGLLEPCACAHRHLPSRRPSCCMRQGDRIAIWQVTANHDLFSSKCPVWSPPSIAVNVPEGSAAGPPSSNPQHLKPVVRGGRPDSGRLAIPGPGQVPSLASGCFRAVCPLMPTFGLRW